MKVRQQVCPHQPYAIGLRLGADAAKELAQPNTLEAFRCWLQQNNAYIFTINGFPHGNFHGQKVKENVYLPDWSSTERLRYTNELFEILSGLIEHGTSGSVSTLPASFKEFHAKEGLPLQVWDNLLSCAETIEKISLEKNLDLHLGMEPEPLGWFETTDETIIFFEELFNRANDRELVKRRIGVNYDCCHLAIEYEHARDGLNALKQAGIRLSKLHLSSALRARPSQLNLQTLESYVENVYLHQVVSANRGKIVDRFKDLDVALQKQKLSSHNEQTDEWRIHFHIPLHASPGNGLEDTRHHVCDTLDWLKEHPGDCTHLEMETYTWEVLPSHIKSDDVVGQVVREYEWTLGELELRGLK